MRHDAKLRTVQRGIGLDAIDERRAAGRRRELPFEGDGRGTAAHDRLKRAKRVCIREGHDLGVHRADPLRQRGQQIRRGNQYGARRGHVGTVYIWLSGHLVIWSLIGKSNNQSLDDQMTR